MRIIRRWLHKYHREFHLKCVYCVAERDAHMDYWIDCLVRDWPHCREAK